jgi:hypothetical protein
MTRRIAAIALALLGLYACFLAVAKAKEAQGLEGLWQARYETPQPMPKENKLLESGSFALLREGSREITAPLFSRTRRLTLIETAGDASLLFLPGRLQSGGYPSGARDCVIDVDSAMELWGNASPLGLAVECDGAAYNVAGVVAAARPLLLINSGDRVGFTFTSALFRADPAEAFPAQAFGVLAAKLSPEQPLATQIGLLAPRLKFLALFPLWLLLVLVARRYLVRLIPGGTPTRAAAMLLLAILGFRLLSMPNPLTPEMLPVYWSDFSFWPSRFALLLEDACRAWLLRGTMNSLLLTLEIVLPVAGYALPAFAAFITADRML